MKSPVKILHIQVRLEFFAIRWHVLIEPRLTGLLRIQWHITGKDSAEAAHLCEEAYVLHRVGNSGISPFHQLKERLGLISQAALIASPLQ